MDNNNNHRNTMDDFVSQFRTLDQLTEGMTDDELELVHRIALVMKDHEAELEEAAERIEEEELEELEKVEEQEAASVASEPDLETSEAAEPSPEAGSEPAPAEETVPAEAAQAPAAEPVEPKPLPVPQTADKVPWTVKLEERYRAWNPKTGLGRFLARDRHNVVWAITILAAVALMTWQGIAYAIPQHVTLKYVTIEGTETEGFDTRKATVGEFLDSCGYKIGELDQVSPAYEYPTKDGETITVLHAIKQEAIISGKKCNIMVIPGTVKENLELNGIEYDKDDKILPGDDTEVTADTKIEVKKIDKVIKTKTEVVKSKSLVVLDPSLASGVEEKVKGYDGKAVMNYTTTYVNGKKKGTKKTVKKWIKKVQNTELRLGTSKTGQKGSYQVKETFTGNTTAYYMGENAHGASGGKCVYGTCAVDPSHIPYGTIIWVEGYGYARANDCGGAIKGNHIDLWMHSYRESCQWGRRYVTVYVLK